MAEAGGRRSSGWGTQELHGNSVLLGTGELHSELWIGNRYLNDFSLIVCDVFTSAFKESINQDLFFGVFCTESCVLTPLPLPPV